MRLRLEITGPIAIVGAWIASLDSELGALVDGQKTSADNTWGWPFHLPAGKSITLGQPPAAYTIENDNNKLKISGNLLAMTAIHEHIAPLMNGAPITGTFLKKSAHLDLAGRPLELSVRGVTIRLARL